jgi:mannonate dehydratase
MKQTWRWFGPNDKVSLQTIKQSGATGVVSALHHIPHGEVWPLDELQKRKHQIEEAGLEWSIIESIPVHEDIKTKTGNYEQLLNNYRQSLKNAAACGITTVCYNFMPVLDWTRTRLDYRQPNGSRALRFNMTDLALFDIYILRRHDADLSYPLQILEAAELRLRAASRHWLQLLSANILMGVPGEASTTTETLLSSIEAYKNIGKEGPKKISSIFSHPSWILARNIISA